MPLSPGTVLRGPLYIQGAPGSNGAQPIVKVIDEDGILQMPNTLDNFYYPGAVASTTLGPTQAVASALVKQLSRLIPQEIVQQSTITRLSYRKTTVSTNGLSTPAVATAPFGNVTLSTRAVASETIPLDIVLATPTLLRDLAARLGGQLVNKLDSDMLGMYASFTTNATQGTGNTALSDATIGSAVALLAATGEPLFLAVHPYTFGTSHVATLGQEPYAEAFLWSPANSTRSLADAGTPTATAKGCWVMPCAQVPRVSTTNHNFLFTPQTFGILFGIETDISIKVPAAAATGLVQSSYQFENVSVLVWCTNTYSGNQTVYASIIYGIGYQNAMGVQVLS